MSKPRALKVKQLREANSSRTWMDSQYDFYKHTHVGSEAKTSEINGNLFYVHAFWLDSQQFI